MPSTPYSRLTADLIAEAAHALREGLLVAFPTETVYGLGADAGNAEAVKRLYAVKGRPASHPVIVHLSDAAQLSLWAADIPAPAAVLAARFWPGPLTMILPRAAHVLDAVTGGQDTVALRVPNHPLALSVLREFGGGVVAPSANRFGKLSPTCADDVRAEFKDEVAMILDGGRCAVGLESTIVDLCGVGAGAPARILRPGMLLPQDIEEALGAPVELAVSGVETPPRVPGNLPSHYAPSSPLRLAASEALHDCLNAAARSGTKFCVLAFTPDNSGSGATMWITASCDPFEYAHDLYENLHLLDRAGGDCIIVERVPDAPAWAAVRDRLQRAATKPL